MLTTGGSLSEWLHHREPLPHSVRSSRCPGNVPIVPPDHRIKLPDEVCHRHSQLVVSSLATITKSLPASMLSASKRSSGLRDAEIHGFQGAEVSGRGTAGMASTVGCSAPGVSASADSEYAIWMTYSPTSPPVPSPSAISMATVCP